MSGSATWLQTHLHRSFDLNKQPQRRLHSPRVYCRVGFERSGGQRYQRHCRVPDARLLGMRTVAA